MERKLAMDKERLECIMSGLNRYELTGLEKRFVQSVEQYFQEKSMLTNQQESILEGVYREKTGFIRNAVPFNVRIVLVIRA
jgi:hypothetical protein